MYSHKYVVKKYEKISIERNKIVVFNTKAATLVWKSACLNFIHCTEVDFSTDVLWCSFSLVLFFFVSPSLVLPPW